jgi:hypothetical protein
MIATWKTFSINEGYLRKQLLYITKQPQYIQLATIEI